jgi:prepilin-type N-terminal cleavage/methylation domain-containing protein
MFKMIQRRRSQKGFTLIELLIVVAIIGIIAAIIRSVGTAWFSWLTDQVGAASAGANTYSFSFSSQLSGDNLLTTLYSSASMFYIQKVPNKDGWSNNYHYGYAGSPLAEKVMGIRSQGRDQSFTSSSYTMGPFVATKYGEDIVWADGFFVQYPAGAQVD